MDVNDALVTRAAFGNLTSEELAEATSDENLLEFCDVLRAIVTRVQMQIEQFNRRHELRLPTEEEISWRQRSVALHARCVALWCQLRPHYRLLRGQRSSSSTPGFKAAIARHRVDVLQAYDPTEADQRLWAVLDPPSAD